MDMKRNRAVGSLMGLAVGDAVGAAVEFKGRHTFEPLTDMIGGGPFRLKVGEWTDDTSLALCLADSLIRCKGVKETDLLSTFDKWYSTGYLSSNGRCFDIGGTTSAAIHKFRRNGETTAPVNGYPSNGGIMRLAPIAIAYCHTDRTTALKMTDKQNICSHAAPLAMEGARILSSILMDLYEGMTRDELFGSEKIGKSTKDLVLETEYMNRIAQGKFKTLPENQISSSGSVHYTLEAALWSVYNTKTYRDAVLMAANLGDDADTVGAVTGQIAGALYGLDGIPSEWVKNIAFKDMILEMANKLYDMNTAKE